MSDDDYYFIQQRFTVRRNLPVSDVEAIERGIIRESDLPKPVTAPSTTAATSTSTVQRNLPIPDVEFPQIIPTAPSTTAATSTSTVQRNLPVSDVEAIERGIIRESDLPKPVTAPSTTAATYTPADDYYQPFHAALLEHRPAESTAVHRSHYTPADDYYQPAAGMILEHRPAEVEPEAVQRGSVPGISAAKSILEGEPSTVADMSRVKSLLEGGSLLTAPASLAVSRGSETISVQLTPYDAAVRGYGTTAATPRELHPPRDPLTAFGEEFARGVVELPSWILRGLDLPRQLALSLQSHFFRVAENTRLYTDPHPALDVFGSGLYGFVSGGIVSLASMISPLAYYETGIGIYNIITSPEARERAWQSFTANLPFSIGSIAGSVAASAAASKLISSAVKKLTTRTEYFLPEAPDEAIYAVDASDAGTATYIKIERGKATKIPVTEEPPRYVYREVVKDYSMGIPVEGDDVIPPPKEVYRYVRVASEGKGRGRVAEGIAKTVDDSDVVSEGAVRITAVQKKPFKPAEYTRIEAGVKHPFDIDEIVATRSRLIHDVSDNPWRENVLTQIVTESDEVKHMHETMYARLSKSKGEFIDIITKPKSSPADDISSIADEVGVGPPPGAAPSTAVKAVKGVEKQVDAPGAGKSPGQPPQQLGAAAPEKLAPGVAETSSSSAAKAALLSATDEVSMHLKTTTAPIPVTVYTELPLKPTAAAMAAASAAHQITRPQTDYYQPAAEMILEHRPAESTAVHRSHYTPADDYYQPFHAALLEHRPAAPIQRSLPLLDFEERTPVTASEEEKIPVVASASAEAAAPIQRSLPLLDFEERTPVTVQERDLPTPLPVQRNLPIPDFEFEEEKIPVVASASAEAAAPGVLPVEKLAEEVAHQPAEEEQIPVERSAEEVAVSPLTTVEPAQLQGVAAAQNVFTVASAEEASWQSPLMSEDASAEEVSIPVATPIHYLSEMAAPAAPPLAFAEEVAEPPLRPLYTRRNAAAEEDEYLPVRVPEIPISSDFGGFGGLGGGGWWWEGSRRFGRVNILGIDILAAVERVARRMGL